MTRTATAASEVSSADHLSPELRKPLRDLILTLADNKRLLGIRYSDWMLGAPTLETGIAASSMAQDEWGHGRLTYALLGDFGDDPKHLEHGREADDYHSSELLDGSFGSWSEMIAASLLLDSAFTVQYGALLESRYRPVHNRVQKLLDEEAFHFQYAAAWVQRLARAPELSADLQTSLNRYLPAALRWLGREGAEGDMALREGGVIAMDADERRDHLLLRVGPTLEAAGMASAAGLQNDDGQWVFDGEIAWDGWDDSTRRSGGSGPDAATLSRVRGDKNRAMLLD
ncbi:MAG TPA: Phenylacetic acid catabolic protein [Longimicrobiaceae bacterium]|nr:Phenylacetic acid catabolic protein [Longimicrobiaceae bacterium]